MPPDGALTLRARAVHGPKNAWYPACTPDEIAAEKPLGRTICGESMVCYRGAGGTVAALEDFCPHRGAPLSLGRVEGDRLVCGCHGLEMGCDGRTVAMPGQRVGGFPAIRTHPAVERHGFVWVWPGDAARADAQAIPDLVWAGNPEWAYGGGLHHIACSAPSIDLHDQPGHLIRRAHQISVSVFYAALGRDVTPVQYAVLRRLQDRPGIDQATLAQEVALDTSTTADLAARLEAEAWITRRVKARGQRCLEVTDAGAAVLARLAPGIERLQHALLDELSPTERTDFMRLLGKFDEVNNEKSRAPLRPKRSADRPRASGGVNRE